MYLGLIALIAATALAIWMYNDDLFSPILSGFIAPLIAICGFVGLFLYSIFAYEYIGAEYKANIINREYGTNYSQIEIFYASDVIDKIREIDRKRIELNGNLFNDKKK